MGISWASSFLLNVVFILVLDHIGKCHDAKFQVIWPTMRNKSRIFRGGGWRINWMNGQGKARRCMLCDQQHLSNVLSPAFGILSDETTALVGILIGSRIQILGLGSSYGFPGLTFEELKEPLWIVFVCTG